MSNPLSEPISYAALPGAIALAMGFASLGYLLYLITRFGAIPVENKKGSETP